MRRLLCILGSMNVGGAETFIMKIYRLLDRTKFQIDFAVSVDDKGFYHDEIKSLGGKVHHITPKSKGILRNFREIYRLVKKNQYKSVLRLSQHSLSSFELLAAGLGGANIRAFRSSNSNTTTGGKDVILHKLCLFMPKMFANVRIAPSTEAAEFMFGKCCIEKETANILHNGIDLDLFRYDEQARKMVRKKFGIEHNFVVGHVGRFNQQKNHEFLLQIFFELLKWYENAVLLLVGTGELEEKIKGLTNTYGIEDKVIFTGVRSDVPQLMCAMDVFIMPSLYEGMPNTVIEAQAIGLPCVISNTITKEANISGLVKYESLHESADNWALSVLASMNSERKNTKELFVKNRYDIDSVVQEFVSIVFVDKLEHIKELRR